MISLFCDLPIQRAPAIRESDNHVLVPCRRCSGKGKEANRFPRWSSRYHEWDPICRDCNGSGKALRWSWAVRP